MRTLYEVSRKTLIPRFATEGGCDDYVFFLFRLWVCNGAHLWVVSFFYNFIERKILIDQFSPFYMRTQRSRLGGEGDVRCRRCGTCLTHQLLLIFVGMLYVVKKMSHLATKHKYSKMRSGKRSNTNFNRTYIEFF